MVTFKEFLAESAESEIEYLVVILPEKYISKLSIVLESIWKPAGYKDFMIRVDPARAESKEQLHVHIAHKKHTSAKNQQVSWNQSGTRHDKKHFNDALGKQDAVRNIAAKVLGVNAISLESLNGDKLENRHLLFEALHDDIVVYVLEYIE
jgi:hypothetical protein